MVTKCMKIVVSVSYSIVQEVPLSCVSSVSPEACLGEHITVGSVVTIDAR